MRVSRPTQRAIAVLTGLASLLAAAFLARADDWDERAAAADAAALRRVVSLWHSGRQQQAWFLYQDTTRRLNTDLKLNEPKQARLAALRREAAEVIGAQFGPRPIQADRKSRLARESDWPQWGGWGGRNNVALADAGPEDWDPGEFDRRTAAWLPG